MLPFENAKLAKYSNISAIFTKKVIVLRQSDQKTYELCTKYKVSALRAVWSMGYAVGGRAGALPSGGYAIRGRGMKKGRGTRVESRGLRPLILRYVEMFMIIICWTQAGKPYSVEK